MQSRRSAFTLIELLVVIAIITILSVVVILTLSPAELLRQGRDSTRLSDLATLNSVIGLYSGDTSGSLGTPGTTYISIVDPTATTTAGTNCFGLGAWPIELGGGFHCPASSTYRNIDGTGWLPMNFNNMPSGAPLSRLPVDPVNTTSTLSYYSYITDGTTFKLTATPEATKNLALARTTPTMFISGSNPFLAGGPMGPYWSLVPGNAIFGTYNFYVMKYPADCSDGVGNYQNTPANGSNGYDNGSTACTTANGRQIASLPGATAIIDINQATAMTYCLNILASLINNNQWQTMSWNAQNVGTNWSGGAVGSGAIYQGHYDGSPNSVQPATSSDLLGYYGTDGPTSGGGSGGAGTNQRRTMTLSNGNVVWDMAGNVWEILSDTIYGNQEPNAGNGGFSWLEFTAITSWGNGNIITSSTGGVSNPAWNSAQGVGKIDTEGANDGAQYAFYRSNWYNSSPNAGIDTLALNFHTTDTNNNIGFRCAR